MIIQQCTLSFQHNDLQYRSEHWRLASLQSKHRLHACSQIAQSVQNWLVAGLNMEIDIVSGLQKQAAYLALLTLHRRCQPHHFELTSGDWAVSGAFLIRELILTSHNNHPLELTLKLQSHGSNHHDWNQHYFRAITS